jgi:hypothetical protein
MELGVLGHCRQLQTAQIVIAPHTLQQHRQPEEPHKQPASDDSPLPR